MGTPSEPFGTVVSEIGVNIREFPSTDSSVVGSLPFGTKVGLRSKVRAQNIDGNDIWYLLRDRNAWVAARHVDNTGVVKFAKDVSGGSGVAAEQGAQG
ncbi:SH3 domain-containing protein [Kitasatospora sp. NPDC057500]|uniref:SH3 domain-containing protein n=1 Tax=Kitasatospora sp. NPDC057500 TaxID=3346151 RepID=UPI0036CDAF37